MNLMLTGMQSIFRSRKNVVHIPYALHSYNISSVGVIIMIRRIKIATIYLSVLSPMLSIYIHSVM